MDVNFGILWLMATLVTGGEVKNYAPCQLEFIESQA
jgi:hypothetical protein